MHSDLAKQLPFLGTRKINSRMVTGNSQPHLSAISREEAALDQLGLVAMVTELGVGSGTNIRFKTLTQ